MLDKHAIHDQLRAHAAALRPLGVGRVALFGSFARGQQGAGSDIDLLVDFVDDEAETFDHFINLCFLLDGLFPGYRVEVVTRRSLSPYLGPTILREAEDVQLAA
ncbi:MAG: nucleotidyltransferase family protein [Hymenobacteraceae bacterium]|nr:nucleotidyltransferase family protein [Hymenobacteraceae bacterium]